jgi:asparagine synthase (glutamine-hydrolysing)
MCGIAGAYSFGSKRPVERSVLKKMTDVISHRGPEGEGFYVGGTIGLGHRRLSIIDMETGDQPMYNHDRSIVLVQNGEIYNYIELKEELLSLGHNFNTTSDTEVIIKAYEQWGIDCQTRFNGMWAFALWDLKKKELFLSRDRIGEKPLNYAIHDSALVFASEIKSIFEFGVPREIRSELIEVYLALASIPGPDTFYKNIYKLLPGHCLIAGINGIRIFKYWDLPEIDEDNMLNDKKRVYEEFAYLFEDSIKIRMRSDVPYGAFLSGGLDSSSIVTSMASLSAYPVQTFTIGFPDKYFDESKLALEVADKLKTNHYEGTVSPEEINFLIKKLSFHFDEPFGDSSAIPTFQVSKFASNNVKMVLTGDGGDEVLSGYDSYTGIKLSSMISGFPGGIQTAASFFLKALARPINGNLRYTLNRATSVLETSRLPFAERVLNKQILLPYGKIKTLTGTLSDKIAIEDYFHEMVKGIPYKDYFYKLMHFHFKHRLSDVFLVKVDRMSMSNSIETRAPFLDYRLIEFMARVDKNVKHQGWERKSVLRNTIGKELPANIRRASKKGFRVPVREWFKDHTNLQKLQLKKVYSILDQHTLDHIFSENSRGVVDYGDFIWLLIMLEESL